MEPDAPKQIPGWGPPLAEPPALGAWGQQVQQDRAPLREETRSEPPRPLRKLGTALLCLLAVGALADAAAFLLGFEQLSVLDRLIAGEDVPVDEIDASDTRYVAAGGVQSVALLSTAIVWLIWFRRAFMNVERIGPGTMRFGRGWAVGSWFVPFLNLWRPKQIANDIWRSGEPNPDPAVPFRDWPVSGWVHWWWGLWIVANLAGNGGFSNVFGAESLEDQRSSAISTMVVDGVSVVAGLLALYVVFHTTRRQDAAARRERPS